MLVLFATTSTGWCVKIKITRRVLPVSLMSLPPCLALPEWPSNYETALFLPTASFIFSLFLPVFLGPPNCSSHTVVECKSQTNSLLAHSFSLVSFCSAKKRLLRFPDPLAMAITPHTQTQGGGSTKSYYLIFCEKKKEGRLTHRLNTPPLFETIKIYKERKREIECT